MDLQFNILNEMNQTQKDKHFLSYVQSWEVEEMKAEQIPQEKIMGMGTAEEACERTWGRHDCSTLHTGMNMGEHD